MGTHPDPAARRGRTLAVVLIAVAPLAAACGTGGSSGSPGVASVSRPGVSASSSPSAASGAVEQRKHLAWAYSRCMRAHGASQYQDPGPGPLYIVVVFDSSDPPPPDWRGGLSPAKFFAAQTACRHLLPPPVNDPNAIQMCTYEKDCSPALLQRYMQALVKLARCMRNHGIPNWPDPSLINSGGRPHSYPGFYIPANAGFDPNSSQVERVENDICDHVAGVSAIAIDGP